MAPGSAESDWVARWKDRNAGALHALQKRIEQILKECQQNPAHALPLTTAELNKVPKTIELPFHMLQDGGALGVTIFLSDEPDPIQWAAAEKAIRDAANAMPRYSDPDRGMTAVAIKEDQRWYQCTTDDDCMVVPGVCLNPVAINRKSADVYARYVEQFEDTSCAEPTPDWEAWRARAQARCVKGRCTLREPKRNVHCSASAFKPPKVRLRSRRGSPG